MNTEEILKAAQNRDVIKEEIGGVEKVNERSGIMYGSAAGILLCTIMVIFELLISKRFDLGKPAILFLIISVSNIYEGIKNGRRNIRIAGIIEMVIAVILIVLYIGVSLV